MKTEFLFFIKYLTLRRNAHVIAYHRLLSPSEFFAESQSGKKLPTSIDFISLLCAENWIIIESHMRKAFRNHNRVNSFMSFHNPHPSVSSEKKILSSSWKNEEAEKSHKISGKNNFLCLWYRWWWCMIECLCYRQYKVKHKNMFRHKIHRFYFKLKESNVKREGRIMEWCGDNFEPGLLTPVIFEQKIYEWCRVWFYELSRNKKDKCMISRERCAVVLSTLLNKHINVCGGKIGKLGNSIRFKLAETVDIAIALLKSAKIMNFSCSARFAFITTQTKKKQQRGKGNGKVNSEMA